eukprot:9204420-Prorocentrum_lima.AAC.1
MEDPTRIHPNATPAPPRSSTRLNTLPLLEGRDEAFRLQHGLHVEKFRGRGRRDYLWNPPKPLVRPDEIPM